MEMRLGEVSVMTDKQILHWYNLLGGKLICPSCVTEASPKKMQRVRLEGLGIADFDLLLCHTCTSDVMQELHALLVALGVHKAESYRAHRLAHNPNPFCLSCGNPCDEDIGYCENCVEAVDDLLEIELQED
jgi:hypothetical protein